MTGEQIFTVCATNSAGDTLSPSVEIWTTKVDHNISSPFGELPLARQRDTSGEQNKHDGSAESRLIDIGMINEAINVQGFLADDSSTSALTKKTNLLDLAKNYRKVKVYWGTDTDVAPTGGGASQNEQTALGNIKKVMVTETPGKVGTEGPVLGDSGEKNFAVQLSITIGTDY